MQSQAPLSSRIRELSAARVGSLLRISGQVVRTHPVHPELVSGTFLCLDCQSVIKDVEQQFKYTQPSICKNPVCANRKRFMLDTNKSRFVDFQKVGCVCLWGGSGVDCWWACPMCISEICVWTLLGQVSRINLSVVCWGGVGVKQVSICTSRIYSSSVCVCTIF